MYDRYLNGADFIPLEGESPQRPPEAERRSGPQPQPRQSRAPKPGNDLLGEVTGGLSQLLGGVMKHFSLEKFDAGDILLVLIILFLYLEDGDNLELVITLGLLLLLGLGDDEKKD